MYKDHFPPLSYLFYSEWGFGPDVNRQGGLSPQVGFVIFIFVFLSVMYFFRKREKQICFWLCIFVGAIFFTTAWSSIFWSHIPFLQLLEFPWRFTALSSFAGAALGALIISKIK